MVVLLSSMPKRWQENLFPTFEEDPEEGIGEGISDLLSANQRRLHSKEGGARDVVLGIETFSALQSKVGRRAACLAKAAVGAVHQASNSCMCRSSQS